MARLRSTRLLGGTALAVFFGAFLFSWFFNSFFIYPLLGISYNLNFVTLITFANPLAALLFLAVAGLVWFGYLGAHLTRR